MTDPAAQFEAMVEAIVDKRLAELGLAANGNEKLLTVDEAAELVRVKPATIRDWIADGRLPEAGRAGRRIRVRAADVLEAVAGGRRQRAMSPEAMAIAAARAPTSPRRREIAVDRPRRGRGR